MSDDTAGLALEPATLRAASAQLVEAGDRAQDAAHDLVAGLRALAATVPGSRAAPAAEALALAWEAEGARWAEEAGRLAAALAATAADAAATDATLAGLLARDVP